MSMERLESRMMCAVTMLETYPGYYEIYGDEDSNEIIVSVAADAQSFSMNGSGGGSAYYFSIFGFGGNDNIRVSGPKGGMVGATISAGDGNDYVSLSFDGSIWGGTGNDTIRLADAFRGEAYGEAGNDYIFVSGDTVEAEIQGGDGHDYLDASGNHYSVVMYGGAGDDLLVGSQYDDQLFGGDGYDHLYGLGGYDYLHGGEYVSGGDGEDTSVGTSPGNTFGVERIYI
jgi:Ca2+-binding RTX toxin-like protein